MHQAWVTLVESRETWPLLPLVPRSIGPTPSQRSDDAGIDVDLGPRAGIWPTLALQSASDVLETNHFGHQGIRHHLAVGVGRDCFTDPCRPTKDPDNRHVAEGDLTTVDQAGLPGEADQNHTPSWLDPVQTGRRDAGVVGGVDHCVEGPRAQVFSIEVGAVNSHAACQLEAGVIDANDMDLETFGEGELGGQEPDRPRAKNQKTLPRLEGGGADRADRACPRLHQGRRRQRDRFGDLVEGTGGHDHLLGQGPRPTAANPYLMTELADVVTATLATFTSPAPEHGVAGDSLASPPWFHSLAQCADPARPLVTNLKRIAGVPLTQVGHLARVELNVGAADAYPLHVNHDLAGGGERRLHFVDSGVVGPMENECAHPLSIPPPASKCGVGVTVPTLRQDDIVNELRGLGDLLTLAVERVTAPVEGVHRAIADRSLRWTGSAGAPARRVTDATIAVLYDAIRVTGSALGTTVGLGAMVAGGRSELFSQSRLGSRVQAAINATWGDELEQRRNELRIEMGLRNSEGSPVPLTAADLTASFPSAKPKVVVLVHGLGRTEGCWQGKGSDGPVGLVDRLAADPSVTPVLVRYNSGRHVSENGAELARLLDQLWRSWPTPIEEMALVGHSMGGLVIRSACHVGQAAQYGWVDTVDKVVTVATPHLGAPLEKAANVVSWGLRVAPESRSLADFLDARSAGIKDLRFGAIVEDDWRGAEPDALLHNTVSNVPPLEGADHHFVAAVFTSDPTHPVGALLGDLMVRAASGTGRGRRRQIEATDVRVLGGRRHFDLLHDPEVLDQVLAWLTTSTLAPAAV